MRIIFNFHLGQHSLYFIFNYEICLSVSLSVIINQTAGSGVTHSEHNLDKTNPLRFIQIWINTRKRGLKPNYGSSASAAEGTVHADAETCAARQNVW